MTATPDASVRDLRLDLLTGGAVDPRRLRGFARRAVTLAVEHGAPLGPVLDVVDEVERARRTLAHELAAALAPVQSVAIALSVLPLALVPLIGRLVGVDLRAFYGTPTGHVVAAVAAVGWLVGVVGVAAVVRGSRRPSTGRLRGLALGGLVAAVVHPLVGVALALLLWRRRTPAPLVGLADALELVAVGTSAGLPFGEAVRRADDGLPAAVSGPLRAIVVAAELGRPAVDAAGADGRLADVADLVDRLVATGGPPTAALRDTAARLRADELADARARAARLPARLTVPTVLGLLPATVVAVGAPLVAAGLDAL